ncbi:hypothetical protein [Gracilimonas sp.]|uniref:hypothetical protein n=1 Tax=Gracilimonas sp. TaxID=1974203 RepID=UPI0032EEE512
MPESILNVLLIGLFIVVLAVFITYQLRNEVVITLNGKFKKKDSPALFYWVIVVNVALLLILILLLTDHIGITAIEPYIQSLFND